MLLNKMPKTFIWFCKHQAFLVKDKPEYSNLIAYCHIIDHADKKINKKISELNCMGDQIDKL